MSAQDDDHPVSWLTYAAGFSLPRYVPAEDLAEIPRGAVRLKTGAAAPS